MRETKFKILPKVDGFTDSNGIHHNPGEVVDLPESYKGETWLEPIKAEPKPVAKPSKVESVPEAQTPTPVEPSVSVPLQEKKSRKTK